MPNSIPPPGSWEPGLRPDSIVSRPQDGPVDPGMVGNYGGTLVAESVTPWDRALICAAPDLYAFAVEVEQFLASGEIAAGPRYALRDRARALVARVRGEGSSNG